MLSNAFLLAFGLVSLGAAAAIPKAIDGSVESPEVKREVDNSVYILTKRGNDDGLYKKDGRHKRENEDGLYKKDGLYDSLYKKDSPYDLLHKKREDEDGLYRKDFRYVKTGNEDSLYKT